MELENADKLIIANSKTENSDLEDTVSAEEEMVAKTIANDNDDFKLENSLSPTDENTNELMRCQVHIPYILNGELYEIQEQDGENVTVKCVNCPPDRLYRGSVRSTGNFHMHIKRRHPDLMEKLHDMKVSALLVRRDRHIKSRSRPTTQSRIYKRSGSSNTSGNFCTRNGFKVPQQIFSHMTYINSQHKKFKTAFKQRHLMQQQQLNQLQVEDKEQQQQINSDYSNFLHQDQPHAHVHTHANNTPVNFIKCENGVANINENEPLDLCLKKNIHINEVKITAIDNAAEQVKITTTNCKGNVEHLKFNAHEITDNNSDTNVNLDETATQTNSMNETANLMDMLSLMNNTCQSVNESLQDIKTIQKNFLLLEYAKVKHLHPTFEFNLCLH